MKKLLSWILLVVMMMTVLCGCGNSREMTDGLKAPQKEEVNGTNDTEKKEEDSDEILMGRYVEEKIELSQQGYMGRLFQLNDGRLAATDDTGAVFVSGDGGSNWEQKNDWKSYLEGDPYLFDIKLGRDGTYYLIYNVAEKDGDLKGALAVITPDGTKKEIDLPIPENEHYVKSVWVNEENRIFITTLGTNIYEIKEDGSMELFLSLEEYGRPVQLAFQNDLMLIDGSSRDYKSILIYDMEQKIFIEDPVLAEFVGENYGSREKNGDYYESYFFFGEENVVYLAGGKGLHRHVLGGSAIEQVIDGNLSVFGNPSYYLFGMEALPDNEFIALFDQGRIVKFTYDPDTPTVPTNRLQVYSLEENTLVRQAITIFQTEYPDVFVEYQIGRQEGDAFTKEDAIKRLNTEIMAGEGPDVLILDGLPLSSYTEKGLLMDLTPVLSGLDGEAEIFPNVADSLAKEGGTYAVPCEIKLPVIAGEEKYLSKVEDLGDMASAVEQMRKDNPGQALVGTINPKGIMSWFAMTSAPAWEKEGKTVDYEAISAFLTETKRIYDAQMDGLSSEYIMQREEINKRILAESGIEIEDSPYFRTGLNELALVGGTQKLLCGAVEYPYGYSTIMSVQKVQGLENIQVMMMPGQSGDVFFAETLIGINATSSHQQLAESFFAVMLGKENQTVTYDGLPVNQAAFEAAFEVELEESGLYGSVVSSNSDGNSYIELDVYWADEQQISMLKQWIESRTTAYVTNERLENAVYEEGTAYMLGKQSLEEAILGIEEKVSLYMAE